VIDLILWGITLSYLKTQAIDTLQISSAILGGILFWIVTWRGQYEISINILTEIWDKNLLNLFVSPLKFSEWLTSLVLLGITKTIISLAFASGVAFLLYKFNIFAYGFYFLPFLALLLMSGWWIGFFLAGAIIRFGARVQTIAWTVPWALAPFSAIFFPREILPFWAQKISEVLPTSYIFEGARQVLLTNELDINKIYVAFILNIFYIAMGLVFLRLSFRKALSNGLQSLY
jgi:ABC-2 type transport system permease protein